MRHDPIDDESRGDSYANKWDKQRESQREIGMAVDENRHGEIINKDE
jgi:hypothetical protein